MTVDVQLKITVRDWLIIDAVLDNTVAVEVVGGDRQAVELGILIREAGWAQARQHPTNAEGSGGWPPADDYLDISLPATAWNFLVEQLGRSAHLDEQIAADPRFSEDAQGAAIESQTRARQVAEGIARTLHEAAG